MADLPKYVDVFVKDATRKRVLIKTRICRGGHFAIELGPGRDNHKYFIVELKDDEGHKVDIQIKVIRGGGVFNFALGTKTTSKNFRLNLPKNCPPDQQKFVVRGGQVVPATIEDLKEW